MAWGQVYCNRCEKDVTEVEVIRSTSNGIIKYDGCSKCGRNFSSIKTIQPGESFINKERKTK